MSKMVEILNIPCMLFDLIKMFYPISTTTDEIPIKVTACYCELLIKIYQFFINTQ